MYLRNKTWNADASKVVVINILHSSIFVLSFEKTYLDLFNCKFISCNKYQNQ